MQEDEYVQSEQIRLALDELSKAVREMTPVGAKPIPANPDRVNLLAQPRLLACRICRLPGHMCHNIHKAQLCRLAIMSTIGFWEDMAVHVAFLYGVHEPIIKAIKANEITYDMRLDSSPLKGQAYEEIFVNRLTRNYLKFQNHMKNIRPKAVFLLNKNEIARYEAMTKKLNDFLLKGSSLSDLFYQSITPDA